MAALKRYVVRKYVSARNITEALEKEREAPVDDVFLADDEHEPGGPLADAIGFHYLPIELDEDEDFDGNAGKA